MSNDQNQIVPANQNPQTSIAIANDLFKDIDFSSLNLSIEALANHNGDLSREEKGDANKIIDQWSGDVIERLRKRQQETTFMINFFEINTESLEEKLETLGFEIAERTGTMELYNAVMEAIDKANSYRLNKPIKEEVDLDDTITTQTEKQKAYEKELALYEVRARRLQNEKRMKEATWKRAIRETDEVKQLLKMARNYSKKVDTFSEQCKDKAQLAKLNVSITSAEMRKALRELLDFTIKL